MCQAVFMIDPVTVLADGAYFWIKLVPRICPPVDRSYRKADNEIVAPHSVKNFRFPLLGELFPQQHVSHHGISERRKLVCGQDDARLLFERLQLRQHLDTPIIIMGRNSKGPLNFRRDHDLAVFAATRPAAPAIQRRRVVQERPRLCRIDASSPPFQHVSVNEVHHPRRGAVPASSAAAVFAKKLRGVPPGRIVHESLQTRVREHVFPPPPHDLCASAPHVVVLAAVWAEGLADPVGYCQGEDF
mmetsp:Transcript_42577/g.83722  ORF Transcript_42577/g.83722 Transcript_42577/m.83722 type:complete len:244 (-) Transcript_42577:1702-2433(-)